MRIWRFADPHDSRFAVASRRGTWAPTFSPDPCPECGVSRQRRVPPMVIEWEPGSEIVGDFTWVGFGAEAFVTEAVLEALSGRFSGFEPGPVEMFQEPDLDPAKDTEPRVWLPYEGPKLFELLITDWVHLDRDRSSITPSAPKCSTCGSEAFHVEGVERRESRWDKVRKELIPIHTPRLPGQGIYIAQHDLGGTCIFRIYEQPGAVFCTDRVRDFVLESGFSNVLFLERGETFDGRATSEQSQRHARSGA
jgi:hypothetical protein